MNCRDVHALDDHLLRPDSTLHPSEDGHQRNSPAEEDTSGIIQDSGSQPIHQKDPVSEPHCQSKKALSFSGLSGQKLSGLGPSAQNPANGQCSRPARIVFEDTGAPESSQSAPSDRGGESWFGASGAKEMFPEQEGGSQWGLENGEGFTLASEPPPEPSAAGPGAARTSPTAREVRKPAVGVRRARVVFDDGDNADDEDALSQDSLPPEPQGRFGEVLSSPLPAPAPGPVAGSGLRKPAVGRWARVIFDEGSDSLSQESQPPEPQDPSEVVLSPLGAAATAARPPRPPPSVPVFKSRTKNFRLPMGARHAELPLGPSPAPSAMNLDPAAHAGPAVHDEPAALPAQNCISMSEATASGELSPPARS